MGIKKLIIILFASIILSGCMQSASVMGPVITVATTGNIQQAGLSFGSNKIIEKETGKSTIKYVSDKIEDDYKKRSLKKDFVELVESNFLKTRKKLNIKGNELFTIIDIEKGINPGAEVNCEIKYADGSSKTIKLLSRIDTENEIEYYKNGGILQYVLRNMLN